MDSIEVELSKINGHLGVIHDTMAEMKAEREKNKDVFWNNMNTMKDELEQMKIDDATCRTQIVGKINLFEEKLTNQGKLTAIISGSITATVLGGKMLLDWFRKP